MNERIRSHFDEIETRLIECPVILSYQITHKDISPDDGKLRIKSALTGGGIFECFLYVKSGYPDIFAFIDKMEKSLIRNTEAER